MKTNKSNKSIRAQRESDVSYNSDRHLFCRMGDNRDVDNVAKLKAEL